MTSPDDFAFPHDGSTTIVRKDLLKKFPNSEGVIEAVARKYEGVTKREYFAVHAMQGILTNQKICSELDRQSVQAGLPGTQDAVAYFACQCADALIEALEKVKK